MSVNHIARIAAERPGSSGPPLAFAAALAAAAATAGLAAALLHWDYAMPFAATVTFVLAGLIALFGWRQRRAPHRLNYLDVAGALLLIGLALGVLIDPQQLLRITGAA